VRHPFTPTAWPLALALLGLGGALVAGGLLAGSLRYPLPYSDVWHYMGAPLDRLTLGELLLPHNEHVAATTKLALWLDRALDHGRLRVVWGINLALVAAALALLGLAAARQGTREAWTEAAVLGLALAGYSAASIAGFPFFLCHLALMLLALAAALLAHPAALARAAAPGRALRLLGALALMLLAQVTLASGAAAGFAPALLLLLAPAPLRRRQAVAFALALLVATLLTWLGLYLPGGMAAPDQAPLGEILLYGVQILGTPLGMLAGPEGLPAATWGGVAALPLLIAAVVRVLRRPELLRDPLPWGAAALLLTCGASMAGVALLRAGTPWGPLDPKYLHYALVTLGAALVLLLAGRPATRRLPGRALTLLAVLLLPLLNLGGFLSFVPLQQAAMLDLRSHVPGLRLMVADPRLMQGLADAAGYQARLLGLRERQLAFEAPGEPRILGERLPALAPRETGGCGGALFEAAAFATLDPARPGARGLRIGAGATAPWPGAALLVFTSAGDATGSVLGYATLVLPEQNEPEAGFGGIWIGYLASDPAVTAFEAYLVDRAAGRRCLALVFAAP
jgi:hypothetical protein